MTEPDLPLPRGAVTPPSPVTVHDFDRAHGEAAKSHLLWQVSNRVFGADCPIELQAWGWTTWWTLGRFVAELRLSPGELLLDLTCGRGGVGLWLACALNVRVVGVDLSAAGVREAADRSIGFVPPGRARFEVGDMAATGLEPESIDGAICADAIFRAEDRTAVFVEMARVLRPGGRFLFTADESDDPGRPAAVPDWAPIIDLGRVMRRVPNWATYDAWIEAMGALRAELGDESADDLLEEAPSVGPTLSRRTGVLYTARKRGRPETN